MWCLSQDACKFAVSCCAPAGGSQTACSACGNASSSADLVGMNSRSRQTNSRWSRPCEACHDVMQRLSAMQGCMCFLLAHERSGMTTCCTHCACPCARLRWFNLASDCQPLIFAAAADAAAAGCVLHSDGFTDCSSKPNSIIVEWVLVLAEAASVWSPLGMQARGRGVSAAPCARRQSPTGTWCGAASGRA